MKSVILFILFAMNLMSGLAIFTTLIMTDKLNSYVTFYLINSNILYFCEATIIFNIVSFIFLIHRK